LCSSAVVVVVWLRPARVNVRRGAFFGRQLPRPRAGELRDKETNARRSQFSFVLL
jgi:hypothetical protein